MKAVAVCGYSMGGRIGATELVTADLPESNFIHGAASISPEGDRL
jgi:hypothetical protein